MAHILIIDDSIFIYKMIEKTLSSTNTRISSVCNARDAFEFLESEIPDLILLSYVLADMDGPDICKQIKQRNELKKIPILFLTSKTDEQSIIQGFDAGAVDYIAKPFRQAELKARVACHLQNKIMADRLRVSNQRLLHMMQELKFRSDHDPLTSIYNRKFFLEHLGRWITQLKEKGSNAQFLLIDIDTFKHVNDTYGHVTGDYVLFTVADCLRTQSPETSYPIRWGGDEFLLVLFDCDHETAMNIGERICKQVSSHVFTYDCDGSSFSCSLTIGVTSFDPDKTLEEALEAADKALYLGKKRGRNCCISSIDT